MADDAAGAVRRTPARDELIQHRHGRCDSTCPSYAHGCLGCRACEAERSEEGIDE